MDKWVWATGIREPRTGEQSVECEQHRVAATNTEAYEPYEQKRTQTPVRTWLLTPMVQVPTCPSLVGPLRPASSGQPASPPAPSKLITGHIPVSCGQIGRNWTNYSFPKRSNLSTNGIVEWLITIRIELYVDTGLLPNIHTIKNRKWIWKIN